MASEFGHDEAPPWAEDEQAEVEAVANGRTVKRNGAAPPAPPPSEEFSQKPLRIDESAPGVPIEKMAGGKRRRLNVLPMEQQAGRMPPQAVDVEQQVIGAMLIDAQAIGPVLDVVEPDEFYEPRHQYVLEAITALVEVATPVDLVTVSAELKRRDTYERVGGYYLTELTTTVASSANAEYHARIIKEQAIKRRLITQLTGLVGKGFDPTEDAFDLLDELQAGAHTLGKLNPRGRLRTAGSAADAVLQQWADVAAGKRRLGLPTGFKMLDRVLGGLVGGRHYVLAAPSKTGKTLLSLDIARHVATDKERVDASGRPFIEPGVGVLYVTVEQSTAEVAQALLIKDGQLQATRAPSGALSAEEWEHARATAERLKRKPIYVMDTPRPSIDAIEARGRQAVLHDGVGLIIVDYVQRVVGGNPYAKRNDQVSEVSARLKALARELDVPVLSNSQVNGEGNEAATKGKPPTADQLSYSAELKNDSDAVLTFYRPEVHGIDYYEPLSLHTPGLGILTVGANRFGPMPEQCVVYYSSNTITIMDKAPPPPAGGDYSQGDLDIPF